MTTDRLLPGRHHVLSSGLPEELWLREDHLLCVKHAVFIEMYQRFYYRDIESVTVTVTNRRRILNLLFGVFLGIGIILSRLEVPMLVYSTFSWIWLILTLTNFAFGATCKTVIRTRVNTRVCTSLRRMRTTRQALELLSERIRAAQAADMEATPPPLAPEPLPSAEAAAESPLAPEPVTDVPPALPPVEAVVLRSHQAFVFLLAIQALVSLNTALYPRFDLTLLLSVLLFIATGISIPALITQRRKPVPPPAKVACWSAAIFQFLVGYAVLMGLYILVIVNNQFSLDLTEISETYNELFANHVALRSIFVVYTGATFALAAWLALTLRSPRRP